MRIAIVSPYSWSYPGGVARHIEALAAAHRDDGHEVRIITPVDPVDQLSSRLHGGTAPQQRQLDGHIVDLGRTVGIPANGAVSNLSLSPGAVQRLGQTLADGQFDVVHIHEPVVPLIRPSTNVTVPTLCVVAPIANSPLFTTTLLVP